MIMDQEVFATISFPLLSDLKAVPSDNVDPYVNISSENIVTDSETIELDSEKSSKQNKTNAASERKVHKCRYCSKKFTRRTNCVFHERNHHPTLYKREYNLATCFEVGCNYPKFISRAELRDHLTKEHNFIFQLVKNEFETEQQFQAWRKDVAQICNIKWVMQAEKKKSSGKTVVTYFCDKSGNYIQRQNKKKSLTNTSKIEHLCTVYLKVTISNQPNEEGKRYFAVLYPDHYHHDVATIEENKRKIQNENRTFQNLLNEAIAVESSVPNLTSPESSCGTPGVTLLAETSAVKIEKVEWDPANIEAVKGQNLGPPHNENENIQNLLNQAISEENSVPNFASPESSCGIPSVTFSAETSAVKIEKVEWNPADIAIKGQNSEPPHNENKNIQNLLNQVIAVESSVPNLTSPESSCGTPGVIFYAETSAVKIEKVEWNPADIAVKEQNLDEEEGEEIEYSDIEESEESDLSELDEEDGEQLEISDVEDSKEYDISELDEEEGEQLEISDVEDSKEYDLSELDEEESERLEISDVEDSKECDLSELDKEEFEEIEILDVEDSEESDSPELDDKGGAEIEVLDAEESALSMLNIMCERATDCLSQPYHHLVSKPRFQSEIWAHFGVPADENGTIITSDMAVCNYCKKSVYCKGSTRNLICHMRRNHPLKHKEMPTSSKRSALCIANSADVDCPPAPSTVTQNDNTKDYSPATKRQKTTLDCQLMSKTSSEKCTRSVAEFLATSMQPYNIVEHSHFKKMLNTLNPKYRLPRRKYFSTSAVPKLYNETTEKIKEELKGVHNSNISITTDCCTSMGSSPFIGITAHFISNDWKLINICLNYKQFDADHTADDLSCGLKDVMCEWKIELKNVACITTDNTSNILKAAQNMNLPHLSCFAHNINIGVNRALEIKELKRAVSKLKSLQNSIAHSWEMKRDLHTAQKELKMDEVTLPSACPTRWWSTLKLCRVYLKTQLAICKMFRETHRDKSHLIIEDSEHRALEGFVSITDLLEDLMKNLGGSNYLTASFVLPLYRKIKNHLQPAEKDSPLLKKLKSEILDPLRERYNPQTPMVRILELATFLDPRFRLRFLEDPEKVKQSVINKISELQLPISPEEASPQVKVKKLKPVLFKYLDFDEENMEELDPLPLKKGEREIKNYLAMPKSEASENPLQWWKTHISAFPLLGTLARKYLPIPGTSVPSEQIFNTGGLVITKHRASLNAKHADMQVFLSQNENYIY